MTQRTRKCFSGRSNCKQIKTFHRTTILSTV